MSVFDLAARQVWAIEESWLQVILEIASREGEGPEAVAARLGRPLQNTRTVAIRDGVAVVPIVGPIFRRANMLTEVSGATSTEMLARDFRTALDDPTVKAIMLDVDSPGGEANGVNEVAEMIHAARGQKPIVAYASGSAASGAYWLASAADEIVIDPTARLGSIGVVAAYRDTRGRDEKAGVRQIEFVSSQSPHKRPDLESDEGRKQIQAEIDAIADVFVSAIARNRDAEVSTVLSDFGRGGVKIGKAAVDARLADRTGSFESVLAELAAYDPMTGQAKKKRRRMMAAKKTEPATDASEKTELVTDEETIARLVGAAKADGIAEGKELGIQAGILAERERILGIDRIALPGHEKLIEKCKADGTSLEDTKTMLLEAEKAARTRHLDALKKDGAASVPAVATETGEPAATSDEHLSAEDRMKARWEREPALRAEFLNDFAMYSAFEKNADRIRVKSTAIN